MQKYKFFCWVMYLLLFLSGCIGASKSILNKLVKDKTDNLNGLISFNVIIYFVATLITLIVGVIANDLTFNVPYLLSILYGLVFIIGQISFMLACANGPVSITSLFYSCGFIISTVWGAVYYNEKVNTLQIIGLVMIIVSFLLNVDLAEKRKFNFKWLIFALLGFMCSGFAGVIQKLFTNTATCSLNSFLFVAFLCVFVLCLIYAIIANGRKIGQRINDFDKKTAVFVVLLGVVAFSINKLNTYLSGVLPSVIMFPAVNGGTIALTAIASAVLIKEKLTLKQIISIIVCISSIVLIAVGQTL